MSKIVYNACFGGFSLSHQAVMRFAEIKGINLYPFFDERLMHGSRSLERKPPVPYVPDGGKEPFTIFYCTTPEYSDDSFFHDRDIDRHDPALALVVEELGDKANGDCAKLRIKEVASGTLYRIDEYDGNETVATQSTYEWTVAP